MVGRRRIRFRFFIFLALLLYGVYGVMSALQSPVVLASVTQGELAVTLNGQSLLIREERVYNAPVYGKAVFHISDGEMAARDQVVALLYREDFDADAVSRLYEVQERILRYQQDNLTDQILSADFERLDVALMEMAAEIQSLTMTRQHEGLGRMESRLHRLMVHRQEVLDRLLAPDETLKGLYRLESGLRKQMEDWVFEIAAPEAGIVSFYLDGLEQVLDGRAAEQLTLEDFKNLLTYVPLPAAKGEAKAEQPFLRLVCPINNWYLAMKVPASEFFFRQGDMVQVRLFAEGDPIYPAQVYRAVSDQGYTLLILQMIGEPGTAVNLRTPHAEISKPVSGLMVPANALTQQRSRTGLMVWERTEFVFMETEVLGINGSSAIVAPISDNQVLRLHDEVRVFQ